jgi:hypothetical protein
LTYVSRSDVSVPVAGRGVHAIADEGDVAAEGGALGAVEVGAVEAEALTPIVGEALTPVVGAVLALPDPQAATASARVRVAGKTRAR